LRSFQSLFVRIGIWITKELSAVEKCFGQTVAEARNFNEFDHPRTPSHEEKPYVSKVERRKLVLLTYRSSVWMNR
jgi:hypothetical protein